MTVYRYKEMNIQKRAITMKSRLATFATYLALPTPKTVEPVSSLPFVRLYWIKVLLQSRNGTMANSNSTD